MPRYTSGRKKGPKSSQTPFKAANRPAKRRQWTNEQMVAAMEAFRSGLSPSINRAAKDHGVPPSTLKDRLSGRVLHGTNPGPPPYLTPEEEAELESYLLQCAQIGYGKTRRQVISIVKKVAEEKGILRPSEHVRDGWWRRFLQRRPKISLRAGDKTGHSRMNAITSENLTNYFDLLEQIIKEHGFDKHPECIYNMDESGVPLDPKPPRVVTAKGQKKVRYRCSGNKAQTTVLACSSATGQMLPPFIIFDAQRLNPMWTRGEIPGTRYGLSPKGWVDQGLFRAWLKDHFLQYAVAGRPLLLILDGHSSHYDPETIRFAKEHNVIMFCLPPHTTHEAQPLDVSFFGPLKQHWGMECHTYYQGSPGRVVTKFNFVELFSKAWLRAIVPENLCSGFRKAGIVPFNRDALMKLVLVEKDQSPEDSSSSSRGNDSGIVAQSDGEMSSDELLPEEMDLFDLCGPETPQNSASVLQLPPEKLEQFERRLEEGYDLPDSEYREWLRVYHPDVYQSIGSVKDFFPDATVVAPIDALESSSEFVLAVTSNVTDIAMSTSSETLFPSISSVSTPLPAVSTPMSTSSPAVSASTPSLVVPVSATAISAPSSAVSTPLPASSPAVSVSTPSTVVPVSATAISAPSSAVSTPLPAISTPRVGLVDSTSRYRNNSNSASGTPKRFSSLFSSTPKSVLAKHIQPVKLAQDKPPSKVGSARVLTSSECLDMLEEKKRKKEQEAIEKENRKLAREEKKRERELLVKKRKEEQEKKKVEREKKKEEQRAEREKKKEERKKKDQAGKKTTPPQQYTTRHRSDEDRGESSGGASGDGKDVGEDDTCAFCFEPFCTDGAEWLECVCGRWVHELCIEEVLHDATGKEKFCPFCINS